MTHRNLELLGAPLVDDAYEEVIIRKKEELKLTFERLKDLPAHYSLHLLKNCLLIPKLTYLLRTVPYWKFNSLLNEMDEVMKSALEEIINISFDSKQWIQATLPIRCGGLGLRSFSDISLPTFLSSCYNVKSNVSIILNLPVDNLIIHDELDALELWRTKFDSLPENPEKQKSWDSIAIKTVLDTKLQFDNDIDKARMNALQVNESNSWLHTIPSKELGTLLDDNTLRISICLRLGSNICKSYKCICGEYSDTKGLHPLNCMKSAGRFYRHSQLNDILKRALTSINIPSVLEPTGMSRTDGKRPDGTTLVPWNRGRCIVWDATCVNTFAASYVHQCSKTARSAAETANSKKKKKYASFENSHIIKIFAVETMGPWSKEACDWTTEIGHKLVEITGERRAGDFFKQRLGLAIQRGNAASVVGSIAEGTPFGEVYYI